MLRCTVTALLGTVCSAVVGCGTDGAGLGRTDPGTGTGTLLADGDIQYDTQDDSAAFDVRLKKGGAKLDGATVRITSALGQVDLADAGDGDYRGAQRGWSPTGYVLEMGVNDASGRVIDSLTASIAAPLLVEVTSPDLSKPIDPRTLPDHALSLAWRGPAADRAEVHTKDFAHPVLTPDPLQVSIPATALQDRLQDLEIRRESSLALVGGLPGSTLTVHYRYRTSLIVQLPAKN